MLSVCSHYVAAPGRGKDSLKQSMGVLFSGI